MFEWSENISYFNEDYLKNYHEDSDVGWILYVGIKYSEQLEMSHNDLSFLSEKKMIIWKCLKLVCNLNDKKTLL